MHVGIIGYGAIGSTIGRALLDGKVPGVTLAAVCDEARNRPNALRVVDIDALVGRSDVVIEAAGPLVVKAIAQRVLSTNKTLVVLSLGAFLTDEDLHPLLGGGHRGQLLFSTGALRGIEFIRATQLAAESVAVKLTSRKSPGSLVQGWMSPAQKEHLGSLRPGDPPETIFTGLSTQAAGLFPANLNVAAALAIAAGAPDRVSVELVADPAAEQTTHEILVQSELGQCTFTLRTQPHSDNPATSAIVPWSVIRALGDLST